MFSGKAISRVLPSHFLVDTALRMKLIKYLLPVTTGSINEKVTAETTDQNFQMRPIFRFESHYSQRN